ncbi:MerR family transcriptional regulator [Streptomyces spirodelae]|uniref:MerR family transcriptional regulator n=1 Tax=Streptomyces spirodelae TaxID=2812904 RepID=A0ABS3WXY7_9ACTN|nr:MerR family transcriptional regulator [Streptomyces spirodelae]MBO8187995.1 MerR family transcriptional regulator [Streptomyces spirodelae]
MGVGTNASADGAGRGAGGAEAGTRTGDGWLTIGAFAKASRLSPKALRLYDELGLLTPARVDPASGYRHYAPEQLDRARLVAWLRRLGMPLARIRHVCDLASSAPGAAAAREVRAYWAEAEAEVAARRDLVTFLVDHLSREDVAPVSHTPNAPLSIRYAAHSDTGRIRENNQDTAYADARLLAVADGFGRAGGDASAAAVGALRRLRTDGIAALPAGELLNALENAVEEAGRAVRGLADADEAGTTLTALLWTGSRLALVHVGDSRAYLLRDGELFQLTDDHTLVRKLLDEGRLSPAEADSYPQPALLARALTGSGGTRAGGTRAHGRRAGTAAGGAADMKLREARAGDRYLLCSDGLSAIVPTAEIRRAVTTVANPAQAVRALVDLANQAGGPDNVSCVVADVVGADEVSR